MKYFLTPWKASETKHQVSLENKTPTKTTHIRGYGFGVTFSTYCFQWKHNFTSDAESGLLSYSKSSISR
jgi:hypothetical protein